MRISELSRRTAVPAATIKYYVREGLLHPPTEVGYNRTEYDESHESRLRLVRALIEVGGVSVAAARGVVAALDNPELPAFELAGAAQSAMLGEHKASRSAQDRVATLLRDRGWCVSETNPGLGMVAAVLDRYDELHLTHLEQILPAYAQAAELAARAETDAAFGFPESERLAETVIVGTVLGDQVLAGLRRLAQEAITRDRLGSLPAAGYDTAGSENSRARS